MSDSLYLVHHGIRGMKWGIRRFQNKDGSLTSAGKKRYEASGSNRSTQPTSGSDHAHRNGINSNLNPSKQESKSRAQHIIEDAVSIDEVRRSKSSSDVKKHVAFDKSGRVTSISKELESFMGTPLSNIDDDDLIVYQAMVLEALKQY